MRTCSTKSTRTPSMSTDGFLQCLQRTADATRLCSQLVQIRSDGAPSWETRAAVEMAMEGTDMTHGQLILCGEALDESPLIPRGDSLRWYHRSWISLMDSIFRVQYFSLFLGGHCESFPSIRSLSVTKRCADNIFNDIVFHPIYSSIHLYSNQRNCLACHENE
ncbi:hypothetical protein MLD38_035080 [Melastoma candidum]|uniref:Uncharacterized protein n=1 Tax=Melastoma candidum TaxID=119954 RepID=A0ACB9MBY3_9MYRT|nr:hypothetical protein MLD38_035080 [Melastoma candidum]